MNKKLLNVLIFTVGAAIGSAVTWKVVKTKYERIAQEEIDSVKSEFINLMQNMKQKLKADATADEDVTEESDEYYPDDDERDFTEKEKEQIKYYKMTSKYRSSEDDKNNEEGGTGDEDEDEVPYINGPYVITPEDFSKSPPGYNAQPLNYFADGVLADDWGVTLDIEEIIGEDAVNHFGEYVDDIVYIRNDRTEIDYEVTRDPRTYGEVYHANPNP